MANRIPQPLRRVAAMFGSFTPGQKAVTLLGVVVLLVGGFFFATWASKPTYAPLFNNLSGADANAIVEQLNTGGVPYELSDGGATVLVPQDQVYDQRLKMSGEGLPAEAASGYALLDKQGVTTSDFMQHVGYQRALEGELSTTIKSIEGVQAATVHLVIPQKDIFSDDEKKPTASVLITGRTGQQLDSEQVQAVVHLVASSVEGLDPKNVTVAGSDGTVLSTGDGKGLAGGAGGDARAQQTQQFEVRMNSALQGMLESVVGSGKAIVKTTADLDFDETETKTQRYTAEDGVPPLTETTTRESYDGGGNTAGGVLGPDNIQVPNGANGSGAYESTSEQRNNAVGMVTETRRSAPGAVRRLNVSVVLDTASAGGIETAQVEKMVSAAAGLDTARGDTMAVTAMPFDSSAADQAAEAEAKAGLAEQQQQVVSMAKTGAMVLGILILLFLAWRYSRKSKRSQLSAEELAELAEMQAALDAAQARELAGADVLPAIEAAPEPDGRLEEREARQKEIAEMVATQPDEVAQLLRGWLADRRS